MALYRVRMEEVEEEKRTAVSYATFHVDAIDDPKKVFDRMRRNHELKWIRAEDEDENDLDYDEFYDPPELVAEDDDEGREPPVRGKPSDFGLMQPSLV